MSGTKKTNSTYALSFLSKENEKAQAEYARAFSAFEKAPTGEKGQLEKAFELLISFDRLSARLYRTRAQMGSSAPARERLEDAMTFASHQMLSLSARNRGREGEGFSERYRRVWRENLPLFSFTLITFLVSLLISWYIVQEDPRNVSAFVGADTIEQVISKERWFDSIQKSAFLSGIQIAKNNISVAITAYMGGALLGIGGLYILLFNGLMFGALLAFCHRHGFHDQLGTFVISHGILELSIIVAAAFSGFLFGRVFYMRPWKLFRYRFRLAAQESGVVLMGILPWLVLAACLEVFVSPWPQYSVTQRWTIGLIAGLAFWGWTFWPLKSRAST